MKQSNFTQRFSNLKFWIPLPTVKGNNISLTLGTTDIDEIRRLYDELSAEGAVDMELRETFWSDLYGMVTDKFGITWQLSHDIATYLSLPLCRPKF